MVAACRRRRRLRDLPVLGDSGDERDLDGQAVHGVGREFLAVYAAVGTAKGLEAGLPAVTCVLLGVATGTGGGLLRDVIVNTQPDLLRPGAFYASAAAVGCTVEVVLVRQGGLSTGAGYISIVVIVALRLVSVWRGWESPEPTDVLRAARRWSKGSTDDTSPT